jgi:hypothetical protein
MSKISSLSNWIQQQLTRYIEEDDDQFKVTSFALFHLRNGTSEEELHTVSIGSKQWEAKVLAERFDSMASTHASGLSGRQQYIIKCTLANEAPCPPFTLPKAGEILDIGLGTEGPTPVGHTAQMMRHNESLMRISLFNTEKLVEQMANMNLQLMETNTKLMNQNAEAFEAVKELIIEKAETEHKDQASLLEYQRKTQERQVVLNLLPGILNKLTGGKLLPTSSMAETVFNQLKTTLQPEQIEKIAEVLNPDQLAPLMQLLTSGNDSEEKANSNGNDSKAG